MTCFTISSYPQNKERFEKLDLFNKIAHTHLVVRVVMLLTTLNYKTYWVLHDHDWRVMLLILVIKWFKKET